MGKYLKMDSCLGAVSREDWLLLSKSQNSASVEIAECSSGVIAEEILHAINSHDELVAEVERFRYENSILRTKLENSERLNRELLIEQ